MRITDTNDLPADLQLMIQQWGNPGASQVERAIQNATEAIKKDIGLKVSSEPRVLTTFGTQGPRKNGGASYLDEIPQIESVSLLVRTSMIVNLEKLLLQTKLETDETMSDLARQRIEAIKGTLEQRHNELRAKVEKQLEAMDEAARNKVIMKVINWVMTIASIVAAAFTFGTSLVASAALNMVIRAAFMVVGAVAMLANQILDETGQMDKIMDDFSKFLKKHGFKNSDMWAQIFWGLAMLTVVGGTMGGGGKAFMAAMNFVKAAKLLQYLIPATSMAMGLGAAAQQGVSIAASYKSGMAEADVQEVRALLQLVQQMVEESQEELEDIVAKIENLLEKMFDIINSKMETEIEVANNLGKMLI